ncbi:hypothetical protein K438DRAFT_1958606 [Mycena galopus ATCC 62051]|nr:hypothetical protein K438DRAFT_1958606 [Mycena galopus ATCC 62051]
MPAFTKSRFFKNWYAVEFLCESGRFRVWPDALELFADMFSWAAPAAVLRGTFTASLWAPQALTWTKSNPHPYLSIEQNQGTKLLELNHKFDKSWSRDKL